MPKHESIDTAMNVVLSEMAELGLLTDRMYRVKVYSQPIDLFGYVGLYVEDVDPVSHFLGVRGRSIYIPRMTFQQIFKKMAGIGRRCGSIRDVLRHEYGHALAVEHPSLIRRSKTFKRVFGDAYDSDESPEGYNSMNHVSKYAATNPAEDFAESFMVYLRVKGDIEKYRSRPGVYRKLRFCSLLRSKLKKISIDFDVAA